MTREPRTRIDAVSLIVVMLCLCAGAASAQSIPETFGGRQLEDALRVLQAHGLRLVFSSELVTPDMMVRTEPRAKTARGQLAELLEPHGLVAENGPRGIVQIVRKKRPQSERPGRVAAPVEPQQTNADGHHENSVPLTYRERVSVTAEADAHDAIGAARVRRLASAELSALDGTIADDPLRVVHTLPGAATGDDFRSEFSVRGSQYRHASVVIDGAVAPWLQHAALGRGDTGTMTMLRGDVVEDAALLVGAYARVDGGQIGPQLDLTLREGSRAARRFKLGVSGMSTTLTAEGPIGSAARGSWLVGVRRSNTEWPMSRSDEDSTVFGFGDVQSKVVYDVRPGQQVAVSLVSGISNVEGGDHPNRFGLADGLNRAAMVVLTWRSIIGAHTTLTQRVSSLTHDFRNHNQRAEMTSRGTNLARAYRVDVGHPILGGVVQTGARVRRAGGSRRGSSDIEAAWLERSGHATFLRALGPSVTLAAGLRLADSTLVHRQAVDRWLQAEWSVAPRWLVHASTGLAHQFAALEEAAGWAAPASLRPEQATYVDVGIGHQLSPSVRWDVTAFSRRERDVLREPDTHPRLVDGILDAHKNDARFENALSGTANGIELTIARTAETGHSGRIAYSYGVARHTDVARHEGFPSDLDQRHAIAISGATALPGKARVGLTFRGGTNVPIAGYLVRRNGDLFAGSERNHERLPAYARLDARVERSFSVAGRQATVFVESLNVLNRANRGPTDGAIEPETGEAVGFTERLFPRLLTAGLRFTF